MIQLYYLQAQYQGARSRASGLEVDDLLHPVVRGENYNVQISVYTQNIYLSESEIEH